MPISSSFRLSSPELLKKWRNSLYPVIGVAVAILFIYWIWNYRTEMLTIFRDMGLFQFLGILGLILVCSILTPLALFVLVRDKGYDNFTFVDAYHILNLTQLAAMIPGGIWGFAGFASLLWSKGINRFDSVIIIFLNTLIMLTSCAIVGVLGLVSTFGWGYALTFFIPFIGVLIGRDWLNGLRQKYFPKSSNLPSTLALLKVLTIGVMIWLLIGLAFTWMLFSASGLDDTSWGIIIGAYATAYLGGYLSFLVPAGLGVSEGLVTLMLSGYFDIGIVLATAISFRIVHSSVIWANILVSAVYTSKVK